MAYTVSQADPSQSRQVILELWKQNLPTASEDRYPWLYQTGRAKAWLLKVDDESAVGATGLMDRTIRSPEGLLRAGQAIDLNVNKDYRSVGPALSLARTLVRSAMQEGYPFIYAFPNADSEPILKRVGYRLLGNLQRWYKPLRCDKILDTRLQNPLARKAVAAASFAVNTALAVKSRETFYRRPVEIHVKLTDRFDGSFDLLWQTVSGQFPFIGERTADYLSWRFGQSPSGRFEVLCIKNACQELLAYLVFSCQDGIVHVNDFLFADAWSLNLLLAEFIRHARRRKAAAVIVVYLGPSFVTESLRAFGFWRRPTMWNAMVCTDWNRLGTDAATVLDEQQWYLTRADIDTDF